MEENYIFVNENEYTLINTLSELEKYKGKVLMYGYWEPGWPAEAWAAKFDHALAWLDENERNPSAKVKDLTVFTNYQAVHMYNGTKDVSEYPNIKPHLDTFKIHLPRNYKSNETSFDGQLFIRTLTDVEMKEYKKVIRRKKYTFWG